MIIYGAFSKGVCLYVGQTSNLKQRHNTLNNTKLRGKKFVLIELAKAKYSESPKIEAAAIGFFKSLGQAALNRQVKVSHVNAPLTCVADSEQTPRMRQHAKNVKERRQRVRWEKYAIRRKKLLAAKKRGHEEFMRLEESRRKLTAFGRSRRQPRSIAQFQKLIP